MTEVIDIELALASVVRTLRATGKSFALVGGLAVSVRAEVRFTRDVDLVVSVANHLHARQQGYMTSCELQEADHRYGQWTQLPST